MIDCTVAWTLGFTCNAQEQAEIVAGLPAAANGLRKAVDEIRAVMSAAGYSTSQYKFVIQGYASPVPVGANIRYPQSSWDRLTVGGCPFYDVDANWAKNTATPTIVDNMRTRRGAEGRALPRRARLAQRARGLPPQLEPRDQLAEPGQPRVGALDQHRASPRATPRSRCTRTPTASGRSASASRCPTRWRAATTPAATRRARTSTRCRCPRFPDPLSSGALTERPPHRRGSFRLRIHKCSKHRVELPKGVRRGGD